MILADKIIRLRKKNGWSQEELAEKMNVTRQAVSKWESAQTIPDLGKVLQLSELFGVTTDYLLKDELELEEFTDAVAETPVRRVTMQEANEFMQWRRTAAQRIALATFLCILSPIPLLFLCAATTVPAFGISESLAAGLGVILLLLIVAAAVAMYILCGFKNAPYEFLDKESFETEYGVKGMVKEKQKETRSAYIKANTVATCICVLSPVPLLIGAFTGNEFLLILLLCVTMVLVGIGVMLFITAGVRWASMKKLLQEGEFSPEGRRKNKLSEAVGSVYWMIATAVYLAWSFLSGDWHFTWIVWPIAGVLFVAVEAVCWFIDKEKN